MRVVIDNVEGYVHVTGVAGSDVKHHRAQDQYTPKPTRTSQEACEAR